MYQYCVIITLFLCFMLTESKIFDDGYYNSNTKSAQLFFRNKVAGYDFWEHEFRFKDSIKHIFSQLADHWPYELYEDIDAAFVVNKFAFFFKGPVYYVMDMRYSGQKYPVSGPFDSESVWKVKYVRAGGWMLVEDSDYVRPTLISNDNYYSQYTVSNSGAVSYRSTNHISKLAYFDDLPGFFQKGYWNAILYRANDKHKIVTIFKGNQYVEIDYEKPPHKRVHSKKLSKLYGLKTHQISAAFCS